MKERDEPWEFDLAGYAIIRVLFLPNADDT
jgi:hypothetical protein